MSEILKAFDSIHDHDGKGGGCVPCRCSCPCGCEVQLGCSEYGSMCSQCTLDDSRYGECRNVTQRREREHVDAQATIATLRVELATAHARIAELEQQLKYANSPTDKGMPKRAYDAVCKQRDEVEEKLAAAAARIADLTDKLQTESHRLEDEIRENLQQRERITALEAERDGEDIIIEVTIADRENMFICHVRGPVTVDQLLAINDDLFSNCDEQPFLGEPEDIAGVRLKAVWVRDGYDDGYWDFTTIARCTYSEEAGEVWTPSDAARGKAGE